MKHDRPGDWLWEEWDGYGLDQQSQDSVVYVTYGDLDLDSDVVRRAFASALQRDGVATSLGHGYKMFESAVITQGYTGLIDDGLGMSVCSSEGYTAYGDKVDELTNTTWAELSQ